MTEVNSPTVDKTVQQGLLIRQLKDARDVCDQVAAVIHELGCTDWVAGRAEGAALAQVELARDALMRLAMDLEIRLGWPKASRSERSIGSYGFVLPVDKIHGASSVPVMSGSPPVTPEEDEAFEAFDCRDLDGNGSGFE